MESQKDLESNLTDFFKNLLEEPDIQRREAHEHILGNIPALITVEQNQLFLKSIDMNELERTIKQMVVDKALGPDGFTKKNLHACWDMIKDEVLEIMEDSWRTCNILKDFNSTFLSLIPKESGVDELGKFKPISLCNVIYKIIINIILNRLKALLPMFISQEKAGFVEGIQILDGILLVHEMIHSLKVAKASGMMIKLDLSKAYDNLN